MDYVWDAIFKMAAIKISRITGKYDSYLILSLALNRVDYLYSAIFNMAVSEVKLRFRLLLLRIPCFSGWKFNDDN